MSLAPKADNNVLSDETLCRLCAEAMGAKLDAGHEYYWLDGRIFAPLTDDAQAMALVKEFDLHVWRQSDGWCASASAWRDLHVGRSDDLNRAIVECVARRQEKAKEHERG